MKVFGCLSCFHAKMAFPILIKFGRQIDYNLDTCYPEIKFAQP